MEITNFNKSIPTWDNGTWTKTEFDSRESFLDFVKSCFKEPGKYDLDETSKIFNEQARLYNKYGIYCKYPDKTRDFYKYWDSEKEKCTQGVIYKHNNKVWYLPREYYMWINFLPIYNKLEKTFTFPQVWDVQIHIALYECIAELSYKHAVIVKKRQIASSYYHCAKLINKFWFDKGAVLKIGASLKKYVNMEGSWNFLDEYKSFLNEKTAWIRPLNPYKEGNWQQKIEVNNNGKIYTVGLKSTLLMTSFEKSETNGVGGPCSIFFHEEAGIAPKMDKTYIYLKSAFEMGDITTGIFIAAGSVGELKDCDPLKEFILNPEANGFLGVETDLIDDNGNKGIRGLFIPEQWGMPPYIDNFGNSEVEKALNALEERFANLKKNKDASAYQLEISQHPRNLHEAFAFREESKFPINLMESQQIDILDNKYPYSLVELEESNQKEIIVKKTSKKPIDQWPVKKDLQDKTGAIQVWEKPDKDAKFGTYLASVDPVSAGKTDSSDSLCSIFVYKRATHVKRTTNEGIEDFIEGDKIVCAWCGRFDDLNETHKRLRLIIEWYNAWTLVENNVQTFILYMIAEKKQRFLVPKNQILFLKETQSNTSVYKEYGYTKTKALFEKMFPMYIEWISEVINEEFDELGVSIKKYYGIKRIPDIMVLKEMFGYNDNVNVDRLSALIPLAAFVKIQDANNAMPVRIEDNSGNLENNKNLYKLDKSMFNGFSHRKTTNNMMIKKSFFSRIK